METITDSQSARMLTLAAYLLGGKLTCKHLRSELRGRDYFHFYLCVVVFFFFFTSTHSVFFNTSCHTVKVSCGGVHKDLFLDRCVSNKSDQLESSDTTYLSDLAQIASGPRQGHRT